MRTRKFKKSVNKKEELPSFLLNLEGVPEDIYIPPRAKKSDSYLGPVFIGECVQFHPPHCSVPLSSFHHFQFSVPSKENILKDLFLSKPDAKKTCYESKVFHPATKPKKVFIDSYPHKCPGIRRIFAPDAPLSEGLGETKSIIEGEMSREVPFCRLKRVFSVCNPQFPRTEYEIVTLSDFREKERKSMSYNQRMAHAHFPKEFVHVRVIGPTIPEAITITKLPSKRQTSYEIDLHLKGKSGKTSNKKISIKDEANSMEQFPADEEKKEEAEESVVNILTKKESSMEEAADSDSIRQESEEFGSSSGHQQSKIIRDEEEGEEGGQDEEEGEEEGLEEDKEKGVEEEHSVMFGEGEEEEGSMGVVMEENPQETDQD